MAPAANRPREDAHQKCLLFARKGGIDWLLVGPVLLLAISLSGMVSMLLSR